MADKLHFSLVSPERELGLYAVAVNAGLRRRERSALPTQMPTARASLRQGRTTETRISSPGSEGGAALGDGSTGRFLSRRTVQPYLNTSIAYA